MNCSGGETGYDQARVDRCLAALAERLARLTVPTGTGGVPSTELAQLRAELARLMELLSGPGGYRHPADRARAVLRAAEREAAEIRARARADLAAAREHARRVRDQAYLDAVQARRDFEAALQARRMRAERAEEILRGVTIDWMIRRAGAAPTEPVRAAEPRVGAGEPRIHHGEPRVRASEVTRAG